MGAAGRKGTKTVRRAAKFLARNQNPDGGYPLQPGADSNAQSTAWAIQGFIPAGRDPANVRHDGSRDPPPWLVEADLGVLAVGIQKSGDHLGIQLIEVGKWFDKKAGLRPQNGKEPLAPATQDALESILP